MFFLSLTKSKEKRKTLPIRKLPLMHPDHAPRTTQHIPALFHKYHYAGPTIEIVSSLHHRRPALVARLICEHTDDEGVVVKEEMTASLIDLIEGKHPHTLHIAEALRGYYQKYVPPEEQEKISSAFFALKDSLYAHAAT